MTQTLQDFLTGATNKDFAICTGNKMHALLKHITTDDTIVTGDIELANTINQHPDLSRFFGVSAKTEVPIAGNINGKFVSRRIDRLLINRTTKVIDFVDYKTDTNKTALIKNYTLQLKEYAKLLQSAYPDYQINGYILWLHDWTLDKII